MGRGVRPIRLGEVRAEQAGRGRHLAEGRQDLAAVGDWVAIRRSGDERSGTIDAVLPRRSRFSRKVAGALTEEQVVAANIDAVFLVMGLDHDYNRRRLERYLLLAYESRATPVVILSKADLVDQVDAHVNEVAALAPGTPVHALSARTSSGLAVVSSYLGPGRTGALLGSSGVGKSTLINALVGSELLETREVRAHDSRGRHTTRHRQLILLPGGGLLIDTPGMRELQMWDVAGAVSETFDDIESLAATCHFSDCRHRDEPRCAVKVAVVEGRLAPSRLASYLKLQDELRDFEARRDARAQIDEKRRNKIVGRSLKQLYKDRDR
ncbi:MAG: ribosome small subunit-dependent GTPase A [Acidobacteria bacterium]|nr:ribosome small subunit-dependent GTPase A [Acidobacteriota bacterium]